MAKIYAFEIHRARPGGVLCPPLGITFPALTRIVQSLSREELDEFGVTDVEPGKHFIHYTLSDESSADRYPGTIERASIRGMPDQDGPSLVIRRHTAEEHAYGYLAALGDISDEEGNGSELCRTDQGLFTLAPRPNRADFPHPLVIYLAEYPTNNIVGSDYWYLALAADGTQVRLPDYEVAPPP
jgi:hypothetical protein